MMSLHHRLLLLVAVAILGVASGARAQQPAQPDPQALFFTAIDLKATGRCIEAIPIFQHVLYAAPEMQQVRIYLAECQMELDLYEAAAAELDAFLATRPAGVEKKNATRLKKVCDKAIKAGLSKSAADVAFQAYEPAAPPAAAATDATAGEAHPDGGDAAGATDPGVATAPGDGVAEGGTAAEPAAGTAAATAPPPEGGTPAEPAAPPSDAAAVVPEDDEADIVVVDSGEIDENVVTTSAAAAAEERAEPAAEPPPAAPPPPPPEPYPIQLLLETGLAYAHLFNSAQVNAAGPLVSLRFIPLRYLEISLQAEFALGGASDGPYCGAIGLPGLSLGVAASLPVGRARPRLGLRVPTVMTELDGGPHLDVGIAGEVGVRVALGLNRFTVGADVLVGHLVKPMLGVQVKVGFMTWLGRI